MRYILDNYGYIQYVSLDAEITCQNNKSCTLYTGSVPENFSSLEDWIDNAVINAYKIVDGNLVLDTFREKQIKEKCAKEEAENAHTTKKYVDDLSNTTNSVIKDELAEELSGNDLIVLNDTKEYFLPKIEIDNSSEATVVVSNKNLLDNEILNGNNRGIQISSNTDKTILLDGKIDDYSTNLNAGTEETTTLKADINVDGKSEQKKLQGYNLINWTSPTKTQSGYTTEIVNNLFKVHGTLDPNSNHIFDTGRKDGVLQLKKGTYTFSISKPLSFQIGLLLFNITWVTLKPGETSKTFTLENDYNYFTYFSCGANKGTGYETLNEEFYIQIVEGTVEKPYEDFCGGVPSPNLDYPQEIKVVDKVGVKVSSKNLIKDSLNYGVGNPEYRSIWNLSTVDGRAVDTDLVYKGMKVVNVIEDWGRRSQIVNLKNDTVYTLSAFIKNNDEAREDDYQNYPSLIGYYGSLETECTVIKQNFVEGMIVPKEWTRISLTFRTGNKENFNGECRIRFEPFTADYKNYSPNIYICGLQLEEGDTMTDYEADFQTTETELLNNDFLASLPNGIKDTIEQNKIVKRTIKKILNETSEFLYNKLETTTLIAFDFNVAVKNVTNDSMNNFLCNRLNQKDIYWKYGNTKEKWYLAENRLFIHVFNNKIDNLTGATYKEKIQNYLKNNFIIFYAELDMPEEKEIPVISVPSKDAKVEITTNVPTSMTPKNKSELIVPASISDANLVFDEATKKANIYATFTSASSEIAWQIGNWQNNFPLNKKIKISIDGVEFANATDTKFKIFTGNTLIFEQNIAEKNNLSFELDVKKEMSSVYLAIRCGSASVVPNACKIKGLKIEVSSGNEDMQVVTSSRIIPHIEKLEVPLKADMQNQQMLYLLKANTNYFLSGLNNTTLNMYSFNGTDRELVYSGTGGLINLQSDKVITYTSLTLSKTDIFKNKVLKPQLEIGNVASEYLIHRSLTETSAQKIYENIFKSYEPQTVIMNDKKSSMFVQYYKYKRFQQVLNEVSNSVSGLSAKVTETTDILNGVESKISELKLSSENMQYAIQKNGGNNLIRNSAMHYGTKFWLQNLTFKYYEQDTPPVDVIKEGEYWICTSNIFRYEKGKVYLYKNNQFVETVFTKKDIAETNTILKNVSSFDNDFSKANTFSNKIIKMLIPYDMSENHIIAITSAIDIVNKEEFLTMSLKLNNKLISGVVHVGLFFQNQYVEEKNFMADGTIYSLFEPTLIYNPEDFTDEFGQVKLTVKIPKKEMLLKVVASTIAPDTTENLWLNTTNGQIFEFDNAAKTWKLTQNTMTAYDITTEKLFVYRKLFGAYYEAPLYLKDFNPHIAYGFVSCYPSFDLTISDTEPTEKRAGMYWGKKGVYVKRAVFDKGKFSRWQEVPIPTDLILANPLPPIFPVKFAVPPVNYLEFADLKIEYGTEATNWNGHPDEIYGKNFKLDIDGFSIEKGNNKMFIDEDEIKATYKEEEIFAIREEKTILKKIKTNQVENNGYTTEVKNGLYIFY